MPTDNNELKNVSLADLLQSNTVEEEPVVTEVEKSPLEKMKEYKETHSGTVVENKDITREDDPKVFKNSISNDRREEDYDEYVKDMDQMIETAKSVTLVKKPQNMFEDAALMDQLDLMAKQNAGKMPENPKDRNGNIMDIGEDQRTGTQIKVGGADQHFIASEEEKKALEEAEKKAEEIKSTEGSATASTATDESEESDHDKLATVLIDKTGFGASNISFTPEEREKLSKASEIRLKEVEVLDIDVSSFLAPEKSYAANVVEETSQFGTTDVPLVASRYRAKMKGLGYGQLGDLYLDQSNPQFETHHKRFSIIYNNIASTTIGKFESFEDFLKKTAYEDMDMLLYGLIVSTYPDVDHMAITCDGCQNTVPVDYVVRDLFDLKRMNTEYLEKLDELMKCPPSEFETFEKNGPLFKRKLIRLPKSRYVIEVGSVSAYDFLYDIIGSLLSEDFREKFAEEMGNFIVAAMQYIPFVRSIAVPNGNGQYVKYSSFEDMIQILYRLTPDDVPVLNTLLEQYSHTYGVRFVIHNVKCPHCGRYHEAMTIDLNQLVFYKAGALMSSTVKVENTLNL